MKLTADAVFSLQPSPTPSSLFSPRRRRFSLQSLSEARRRPTPTPSQLSQAHRRSTSAHAVEALNSLKLAAAGPYRLQRHRSTADQLRPTPINPLGLRPTPISPLGLRPTPISPLSSPPISHLFHFKNAAVVCDFCDLCDLLV
ncbi:hypothetical protein CMV_007037 [Castanea mollissima]|uniref:Uncharacterized protein n=1 Tax=Castanea mollissima TaxID=60419 RepID=A0A8J4VT13_9ROSI|nr:hypothetical protein CMV_007037 [Castanea mollissima]